MRILLLESLMRKTVSVGIIGSALILGASCSNNYSTQINQGINTLTQAENKKGTPAGEANFEIENLDTNSQFIIQTGKHPEKSSVDYYSVIETQDAKSNKNNILVSGKTIIIADGSPTDIKATQNLASVTIEAEELIVKKPINFLGANVNLNVKKLVFTDSGKIITTPNVPLVKPDPTKDGSKGDKGGDIILNVSNIDLGGSAIRFDVSGGAGQAAGWGVTGAPGKSIVPLYENVIKECTVYQLGCVTLNGEFYPNGRTTTECRGSNDQPTEGSIGTIAGHPGIGGDGGNIIIVKNISLDKIKSNVNINSGPIGTIAPDTKRGAHGTPVNPEVRTISGTRSSGLCDNHGNGGKAPRFGGGVNSIHFKPMDNIESAVDAIKSPTTPVGTSSVGQLKQSFIYFHVSESFTANYFSHQLDYITDLYRNNYFQEAEMEIVTLLDDSGAINDDINNLFIIKDAKQLLNQLRSHKDINGMDLNAVPELSLNKIATAYKSEINNAFDTIKFTSYFSNKIKTAEEKRDGILKNKDTLSANVISLKTKNEEAYEGLSNLRTIIAEVERDQEAFDTALKQVEAEIASEAQGNINSRADKNKFLGAIKLIANLSKVFPAGQPATTTMGTSIDTIISMTNSDDRNLLSRLQSTYEIYNGLKNIDLIKSKEDWNSKYRELNSDKFRQNHPELKGRQLEEYIKNMHKSTKPIYDVANEYYKNYIQAEVPRTDYEREIAKIKALNPRFQELTAKLSQLQAKRAKVNNLINQNMAVLSQTESDITKSFALMEAADSEYINFTRGLNFSVDDSLKFFQKSARDRLLKYKMLLAKAYTYRLLAPYPGNLDLENVEAKLKNFTASDAGETVDADMLKKLYQTDLKQIAGGIFDQIESGNLKEYESEIGFNLNSGELEALSKGQQIVLNLEAKKLLKNNEYNARIISIELDDVSFETQNSSGNLDLVFEHSGKSSISKNNVNYNFVHLNTKTNIWISRFNLDSSSPTLIKDSKDAENIFSVFFDENQGLEKQSLYERVGFNSEFFAKLNGELKLTTLKSAHIKVKYSFSYL